MKFAYQGYEKSGAQARGTVEAADTAEATEVLRRRGVFVSEIVGAGAGQARAERAERAASGGFGRGKRLESVASFTRQLSLLVSTGTPLVEAMASLERQAAAGGEFRRVLADIRQRVEEGGQLSDAMAQHPAYFDAVCRSLVCAGEQGGRIEVMLDRLSKLIRQQVKVRKTVQGAMIYPVLLIFVAVIVVTALLGFVLPRFEGLFKTLDTPLPGSTKVLMSLSGLLRAYWWMVLGCGVGLGVGLKVWLSSAGGREALDRALLTTPQVGRMSRSFATARIARMLGTLLDGKVALLDALELTKQSMRNSLYVGLLTRAQEAVTRGENVSAALADPVLIDASVCDALKSGEKTGRMATVLVSVADHMDEDNEVLVKTLTGLMEPAILVILGLIVGVIAISMFLPLFDLTAASGGGA
jgi:type IV pilus assembly protein PilC